MKKVLISEENINVLFSYKNNESLLNACPEAFVAAMHVYALAWFREQPDAALSKMETTGGKNDD